VLDSTLRASIIASQRTPLSSRGGYSPLPVEQQAQARPVDKSIAETADHERFFKYFPGLPVARELQGKDVLDFGSGYGGRTIEYARRLGARHVSGIEPVQTHIDSARELAVQWGVSNVDFKLCSQDRIPYDYETFDAVTTFDVLEHVANPAVSLAELHRVLRKNGKLYAVFPLYRGMFAHHLDYVTLLPAVHLVFSPQRIMRVVNGLLDGPISHIQVDRHPTVPCPTAVRRCSRCSTEWGAMTSWRH
jgi:SAM-dependent methyltransferase